MDVHVSKKLHPRAVWVILGHICPAHYIIVRDSVVSATYEIDIARLARLT
jgi:hypothetical protein